MVKGKPWEIPEIGSDKPHFYIQQLKGGIVWSNEAPGLDIGTSYTMSHNWLGLAVQQLKRMVRGLAEPTFVRAIRDLNN